MRLCHWICYFLFWMKFELCSFVSLQHSTKWAQLSEKITSSSYLYVCVRERKLFSQQIILTKMWTRQIILTKMWTHQIILSKVWTQQIILTKMWTMIRGIGKHICGDQTLINYKHQYDWWTVDDENLFLWLNVTGKLCVSHTQNYFQKFLR